MVFANTYSHQWQQDDCAVCKDKQSRVHSSLFKGSPVKTVKHVRYAGYLFIFLLLIQKGQSYRHRSNLYEWPMA